jgi:hypothetical protein
VDPGTRRKRQEDGGLRLTRGENVRPYLKNN